jgi:hypothetical protein
MMKKQAFYFLLALFYSTLATGQLNFTFLPELYGRSVDGLGRVQFNNMTGRVMEGHLFIGVNETSSGNQVLLIKTPLITIPSGSSNLQKSLYNNSSFQFSGNAYGAIASQTRNFAPGEYTFCFRFVPLNKLLFDEYENCFDGVIQPMVPLSLLLPEHKDSICNKRPLLNWQPPIPFSSFMRFRLVLTEKTTKESSESLLKNRPLLLLDNISGISVNYPAVNPDLKEGQTYCWQVIAYERGLLVSRSEIWEFTVKCKEELKPGINDSYRELKLLVNGNYYIANRSIRFSYRNEYNIKKLRYEIFDIGHGGKPVKGLPDIKLNQGVNKIEINLLDMGLKDGNSYLLKVFPFDEPPVEIRFVYKDVDVDEIN